MKDRGWPHARSTAGSPDAIIAIGRERGRHRAPPHGRGKAHHRHAGAAAERAISRCGRQLPRAPYPNPTPPCARVPPSRHTQPSAEPVGGAQLPSPPQQGGAPQRHHRWLQPFVWAAVKRRDGFPQLWEIGTRRLQYGTRRWDTKGITTVDTAL